MNIKTYLIQKSKENTEMVFFVTLVIFFVTSIIFMNFGLSLDSFFSPIKKARVLSAHVTSNVPTVHNPTPATNSAILNHSSQQLILNKSPRSAQQNINRSGNSVSTPSPVISPAQSNIKIDTQQPTPSHQISEYTPTPTQALTNITPTKSPCVGIGHTLPCIPEVSITRPRM